MSSARLEGDRVLRPGSVLVTGANRGLGLEMVKQLLKLPQPPAAIICTCRQPTQAQELQQLAESNPSVKVIEFDVTHFDRLESLVDQVRQIVADQGLNMLVNNAGTNLGKGLDDTSVEDFVTTLNVNLTAPFALVKAFLPLLKQAASLFKSSTLDINRASVVNVGSFLGSIGSATAGGLFFPDYGYRASKAGLIMMTKLMGLDLAQHGILALAVHPGWVLTENGGPSALIKTDESITKLLRVLGNVTEEHSGLHVTYEGEILPW